MPDAPFPIRWSWEAWHGAYGHSWEPHWKPWPYEKPFVLRERVGAPFSWPVFEAWLRALQMDYYEPPPRPTQWPDLRVYTCPGCMKPQYGPGFCGICEGLWVHAQTTKPYFFHVITGL